MSFIFAAVFFAAIETAEPIKLPAIEIVGAKWCGPCQVLKQEWKAAASRRASGYWWRQWIEKRYRITFVEFSKLPKADAARVKSIPAIFIDRGGGRSRVLPVKIYSRELAVASLGSLILRKYPPKNAQ